MSPGEMDDSALPCAKMIRQTFSRFAEDLSRILGDNLIEIVIHGSYVLGDFQPNRGDLDFIVLTDDDLDGEETGSLIGLHEEYRSGSSMLLYQLEGTYCPESFTRDPGEDFNGLYIGTGRMEPISHRRNSYMDLRLISRKGLRLLGSDCSFYDPEETEIREEQRSDCMAFRSSILEDGCVDTGLWESAVHWCARTIYYRTRGRIGSKTVACRWCSEQPHLAEFRDLFLLALTLRSQCNDADDSMITRVSCLHLIDHVDSEVLNRYQT